METNKDIRDSDIYNQLKGGQFCINPIKINSSTGKKDNIIMPLGWNNIKTNQVKRDTIQFRVNTGKEHGIIIVDLDKSKKEGEIDGIKFWEENLEV